MTPQVDWLSERMKRCRKHQNGSKEIRLGAFSEYSSPPLLKKVTFNKSRDSCALGNFWIREYSSFFLPAHGYWWFYVSNVIVKMDTLSSFRVIAMVVLPVTW